MQKTPNDTIYMGIEQELTTGTIVDSQKFWSMTNLIKEVKRSKSLVRLAFLDSGTYHSSKGLKDKKPILSCVPKEL